MAVDNSALHGMQPAGMSSPGRSVRAVTPADGSDLPDGECRSLFVSVAGNVAFIAAGDTVSVTWPVTVGMTVPVCVKRVLSTGTTATVFAIY